MCRHMWDAVPAPRAASTPRGPSRRGARRARTPARATRCSDR
jgi:hypothetical protein